MDATHVRHRRGSGNRCDGPHTIFACAYDALVESTDRLVELDQSGDPWVGTFPGLGEVRVYSDGSIEVETQPDQRPTPESDDLRARALRFGWGEPLSFARRGYACVSGAAVVRPASDAECVVLVGDSHDMQIVLVELVRRGYRVLADRFVPTRWDGDALIAFPREAPVLVSARRAEYADMPGEPVRARTDAVALECEREHRSLPVKTLVIVGVRRPNETSIDVLFGRERFESAGRLRLGGVFAVSPIGGDEEAARGRAVMGEHLRLARLPYARLLFRSSTIAADAAALEEWLTALDLADSKAER